MVDYSKWDKMDFSSSDDESEDEPPKKSLKRTCDNDGNNNDDGFSDEEDRAAFQHIRNGEEYYTEDLRYVKHCAPNVTNLNLNMQMDFDEKAWHRVGYFLKNNQHLRRLTLTCCKMDEFKLKALLEGGLMENTTLTKLNLSGNQHIFYYDGMKLLSKYLAKNKNIVELDLSETDVTPDALKDLALALDGSKITFLDLSNGMLQDDMNCLGGVGGMPAPKPTDYWEGDKVVKLFEDINFPELEDLTLKNCQAMTNCCEVVAHLLKKKDSKLREVDLSGNELCGMDIDILKDAVKDNTSLGHLNLSYNEDVEDWVQEWIEELAESKSSLTVKCDM